VNFYNDKRCFHATNDQEFLNYVDCLNFYSHFNIYSDQKLELRLFETWLRSNL